MSIDVLLWRRLFLAVVWVTATSIVDNAATLILQNYDVFFGESEDCMVVVVLFVREDAVNALVIFGFVTAET